MACFCSLAYSAVRLLLEILVIYRQTRATLLAEVLALRQSAQVLERQIGRLRWRPTDRILLAAVSRALPRRACRSPTAQPPRRKVGANALELRRS
jgi:hypothetical protein